MFFGFRSQRFIGVEAITYARSRLWLGIFGVGTLVVISTFLLVTGLPLRWLPDTHSWSGKDFRGLLALVGCLIAVMAPLDLLGGFLLPNRSRPNTITATTFFKAWIRGVMAQASFFVISSLLILAAGRSFGLAGAALTVFIIGIIHVAFQLQIAQFTASLTKGVGSRLDGESAAAATAALQKTSHWGWKPRPIVVLDHHDTGFTGGVVGLPGMESIVVPKASLSKLTSDQLAVTIARRLEAIESGSRTRGILLAFAWVILGFVLSAMLPGAGVTSVGELAMTFLGFTLWTFLGLLTLPTLSRQASYAIDRTVLEKGLSPETFYEAVQTLDRMQDDEPKRSAVIETIFHPVPSVENRRSEQPVHFRSPGMRHG